MIERVHNVSKTGTKRATENAADSPPRKHGRPRNVFSRYPPIKDDSVDDVATSRNETALAKELSKEKPRKDIVLQLAQQTYISRRQFILSESGDLSVRAITEKYAILTLPYAVSKMLYMYILYTGTDLFCILCYSLSRK